MLTRLMLVGAMATLVTSAASAQVSGIVTDSTVDVGLTPGARPGGNYHFEGLQLDATINDRSPSAASYTTRSDVDGPEILFVNGNATAGSYASTTTLTSLDVMFTNTGPQAVDATLRSTLLPAGFGFFVSAGSCATGAVTSCGEAVGGPALSTFPNARGNFGPLALASFEFDVLSDGVNLFSLSGSVALVYDPTVGRNVIVTDIGDAARVLNGFTLATAADNPTALAFVWDATDIDLALGTIGAGQSRVLTYTTSATSFTRGPGRDNCGLAAFSEFGDPIGRGGSIPLPAFARSSVSARRGRPLHQRRTERAEAAAARAVPLPGSDVPGRRAVRAGRLGSPGTRDLGDADRRLRSDGGDAAASACCRSLRRPSTRPRRSRSLRPG